MQKVFSVLVVSALILAAGCGFFKKGKKGVGPEDVGKQLAALLCEKHAGCQQPGTEFNKDQCVQEISVGLTDRLKAKTDLTVEQPMLDSCTKAIQGGDCAMLTSEAPPVGCEFLE